MPLNRLFTGDLDRPDADESSSGPEDLRAYLLNKMRQVARVVDAEVTYEPETDDEVRAKIEVKIPPGEQERLFSTFSAVLAPDTMRGLIDVCEDYQRQANDEVMRISERPDTSTAEDVAEQLIVVASVSIAMTIKDLLGSALEEITEDADEGPGEEWNAGDSWTGGGDKDEAWDVDDEEDDDGAASGNLVLDPAEMDPEDETLMLAEVELEPVNMQVVLDTYLELQEYLDPVLDDEGVNEKNPMYNGVVQDVMIVINRLCGGQINIEVLKALWQDKAVQEQLSILDIDARTACYHTVFHNVAHEAFLLNDRFNMAYGADGEDQADGDCDSRSSDAIDALVQKLLERR